MKKFYAWGTLLGAVIGAGIFALPQAAYLSGWPYFLSELLILAVILGYVHNLYARILDKNEEKNLLGLLSAKLGWGWFYLGIVGIFGGMLAALTGYLILGGEFLHEMWPNLSPLNAAGVFWIVSSLPLFFRTKTFLSLESWGAYIMGLLILVIGSYGLMGTANHSPQTGPFSLVLPFGALIFALSGWTAVEPIVKDLGPKAKKAKLFFAGSILIALLYAFFVFGVLRSAAKITPDTVSGLGWGAKALFMVGLMGIFAIWTSYLPSALEIKNSLKFAKMPRGLGFMIFLLLPLIFVAYGVNDFLKVVSIGGGIFIALEYLLILRLGTKVLKPKFWEKILVFISACAILSGALYEIFFFLNRIP
jgi:amino acid permease